MRHKTDRHYDYLGTSIINTCIALTYSVLVYIIISLSFTKPSKPKFFEKYIKSIDTYSHTVIGWDIKKIGLITI